jgi:hypothetical protein
MLPRPSRLLGRTLGRTLRLVGLLAMRMGVPRRALLVVGGKAVSALLLVALALVLGAGGR